MWQIRNLRGQFLIMVWGDTSVILCILCMTMMVWMVTFEKEQEQGHQGTMIPHGIAFRRSSNWSEMVLICSWLPMAWFRFMMTFLWIIFLLLTSFLMLVSMPSARQVDMVYLLKFRLAPGDLTCLFDKSTRNTCHQARYLSTWKNDQLVEFKIPRNPPPQRRQTAWEFMGQEVPENYLNLFNNLFQERKRVEVPSGSASAEVVGTEDQPAEASSSSAPAEVFWCGCWNQHIEKCWDSSCSDYFWKPLAPFSCRSANTERQQGWKSHQSSWWACVDCQGIFMVSTSQQESLRAQGITRLGWERLPLAGHSVSFFTRSWEIGRMTAYVKNYSTAEEKIGHWYFCRICI